MDAILLFLVYAVTVEALVEYGKAFFTKDKNTIILQLCALVVAVFLCIASGADIFSQLGVTFAVPYVGSVMTGIFASRGANYASDIIGRLQNANTAKLNSVKNIHN